MKINAENRLFAQSSTGIRQAGKIGLNQIILIGEKTFCAMKRTYELTKYTETALIKCLTTVKYNGRFFQIKRQ